MNKLTQWKGSSIWSQEVFRFHTPMERHFLLQTIFESPTQRLAKLQMTCDRKMKRREENLRMLDMLFIGMIGSLGSISSP